MSILGYYVLSILIKLKKTLLYSGRVITRLCDFDAGCQSSNSTLGYVYCCSEDECNGFTGDPTF